MTMVPLWRIELRDHPPAADFGCPKICCGAGATNATYPATNTTGRGPSAYGITKLTHMFEIGRIAFSGPRAELVTDDRVRKTYLGLGKQ